ncbi:MAG: 50S ribosomal protein L30 [Archaeoglobaceae archaeon]|nr:50S ribosomal protein L30 [Archaeoglobaceae archaeon]MCX8151444.1 50S ribosomal protein L30 [Archaeoglobaceae archaeon]MDW8014206.1 50S ribosomal protein L30 [Archaeoglobaceae archaeon]
MLAVVRLRGTVEVHGKIDYTLKLLRLHKRYHCVLVPDTRSYRGMLNVVKDYIAYGEIDAETLSMLLRERGKLVGNKKLTDEYVKEKTSYENIDEFAKAVIEKRASLKDLPDLKPVFRLHPPRGGLKNIKWHYPIGSLGYHGRDIKKLLYKMR